MTRNRSIRIALGALAVGASAVAFAAPAAAASVMNQSAPCASFEFGEGLLRLVQSNGFTVNIDTGDGVGPEFAGVTAYAGNSEGGNSNVGVASGTIDGNTITIDIDWDGASYGIYEGEITSRRSVEGTTYDYTTPSSTADWRLSTSTPLVCG